MPNKIHTPLVIQIDKAVSPRTQKVSIFLIEVCYAVVWFPTMSILFISMASMHVDGLLGTALVLLAALVGYTSLLFNRARAHGKGALQRRTLIAAELGMRATLSLLGATLIGASIFGFLSRSMYPPSASNWFGKPWLEVQNEFRTVPLIAGGLVLIIVQSSFIFLHKSIVLISRRYMTYSAAEDVFKQYRRKLEVDDTP